VAVYTADPTCEYYILKVTRSPTILETNKSDSWGNTFAKGTHVVEGLYYNKNNRSRFGYKLLHDKPAIVYTYAILQFFILQFQHRGK